MKKRLCKSAVKPLVKPNVPSQSRILESLTGSDALSILKILADRDERLAREIDAVAGELLGEVNVAGVAANVKDELESLDVDDIFDKSGARRDGYVDPGEAAFQMFEEAADCAAPQISPASWRAHAGCPSAQVVRAGSCARQSSSSDVVSALYLDRKQPRVLLCPWSQRHRRQDSRP